MTTSRNFCLALGAVLTMLMVGTGSAPAGAAPPPLTSAYIEIANTSDSTPVLHETAVSVTQNTTTGALQINATGDPGGGFSLLITAPNAQLLSPGVDYDTGDGLSIGSAVNGATCTPGSDNGTIEVDQAQFTAAGTPTTLGIQFEVDCDNGANQYIGAVALNIEPTTPGQGYYIYGNDGSLAGFGNDSYLNYLGDLSTLGLNKPIVGMATTPDGGGYWMVASDGGIFTFGDAQFHGSTGNLALNKPIVGMAVTHDGGGYWLVASDGGIFSFGDAAFHGSTGNIVLNKPIVGMAVTHDGGGYWLVASDGGIFAFGDAAFHGSTGNIALNKPIVGMSPTPGGGGYLLVATDGGIFAFGDAQFHGSTGSLVLNQPIVGMTVTQDGGGYWLVASDGGVFAFGDAPFGGSLGGLGLTNVVGITH
jgi:hypothetical protein